MLNPDKHFHGPLLYYCYYFTAVKAEGQLRIVAAWKNSIEINNNIAIIVDDDCDTSNKIVMDYNLVNNINYEQWYRSYGGESWSLLLETTVTRAWEIVGTENIRVESFRNESQKMSIS